MAAFGVLLVAVAGTIALTGWLGHPTRPTLSPTVSYPAMLEAAGGPGSAQADRGSSVSRSSARGASASASPTHQPSTRQPASATPTRPPRTSRPPAPPAPSGEPSPPEDSAAAFRAQVLQLTNTERAQAGCQPLRTNLELRQAAQAHTQDMAEQDYFSHTGSDGSSPWDRARAAGYQNPSGENIALGYRTPAEVMDAWMASPGHRENILNCDSTELGVGYLPDRGGLWTQLFGFG